MDTLKDFLNSLWSRIKSVFSSMYNGGIGQIIKDNRWFKAIVDIGLIVFYGYMISYYGMLMPVALVSIGMMMSIINRITATEDGLIIVDVTKPFLTIALFSTVSILYSFVREIAFISSVLVIPLMTRQIEDRINQYYTELTPSGA